MTHGFLKRGTDSLQDSKKWDRDNLTGNSEKDIGPGHTEMTSHEAAWVFERLLDLIAVCLDMGWLWWYPEE